VALFISLRCSLGFSLGNITEELRARMPVLKSSTGMCPSPFWCSKVSQHYVPQNVCSKELCTTECVVKTSVLTESLCRGLRMCVVKNFVV
jgi:hypothetical protein